MRISDWSSDVCSSDLDELGLTVGPASCGHEDAHRGTDILKNANMPAKCRRRRRRKVLRTHDFRPFAGDEFSECQVCLCEPRLVRLKRPRHSPRRLLVEGNACCGIKAGDLLLTALPIDDKIGRAHV